MIARTKDPAALLLHRMRIGELEPGRVKAAAKCGHEVALNLFPGADRNTHGLPGSDLLEEAEQRLLACDIAEAALWCFSGGYRMWCQDLTLSLGIARRFARGKSRGLSLEVCAHDAQHISDRLYYESCSDSCIAMAVASLCSSIALASVDLEWVSHWSRQASFTTTTYAAQRRILARYLLGEVAL